MKKHIFLALFTILMFLFQNTYGQENLTFTINGVTFQMVFVEGGSFVMGCPQEQSNCQPDERPSHKVILPDFFIGEFQVTQELWQAVMGTNLQQQWLKHLYAEIARLERLKKLGIPATTTNIFIDVPFHT